jgi:ABC-type branched-subunit amino acid transport system ATPase component
MRVATVVTGNPAAFGARWRRQDMRDMFPNLQARVDTAAGVLSGGEKQMPTMCRTLLGDAGRIMIAEPIEGLAPLMVKQVGEADFGDRPTRTCHFVGGAKAADCA